MKAAKKSLLNDLSTQDLTIEVIKRFTEENTQQHEYLVAAKSALSEELRTHRQFLIDNFTPEVTRAKKEIVKRYGKISTMLSIFLGVLIAQTFIILIVLFELKKLNLIAQ